MASEDPVAVQVQRGIPETVALDLEAGLDRGGDSSCHQK